jgi:hypothetical protein
MADVIRIILMMLYIIFTIMYRVNKGNDDEIPTENSIKWDEKRAEVFTLLVLISSLSLLQYFRIVSRYRALIKMIIECTKECVDFLVVLAVLIAGFTLATYYRQILLLDESDADYSSMSDHGYSVIMTALGDFGAQTENLDSMVLYAIFFLATLIILIVMMNLLIGIISERLAEVIEQKEKNSYFELCQLICDLENIMFWRRGEIEQDSWKRHFVWAELQQQSEPWEGRVRATTRPIDRAIKDQAKISASQNNAVETQLTSIGGTLDDVN